jgi:PAS domain-containing protein
VATLRDVTRRKRAQTALRDSEDRQTFLLRLSDALRPLDDPTEIQDQACHALAEHLNVERSYYVEVDEAAPASRGWRGTTSRASAYRWRASA